MRLLLLIAAALLALSCSERSGLRSLGQTEEYTFQVDLDRVSYLGHGLFESEMQVLPLAGGDTFSYRQIHDCDLDRYRMLKVIRPGESDLDLPLAWLRPDPGTVSESAQTLVCERPRAAVAQDMRWLALYEAKGGETVSLDLSSITTVDSLSRFWLELRSADTATIRFRTLLRNEIDCADRRYRVIETVLYDSADVTVDENVDSFAEWDGIPPESNVESMYTKVCKG